MKKQILSKTGGALALGMVIAAASNSAEAAVTVGSTAWKFGVMSDTQWTGVQADQVNNPNNVAVSMIK